MAKEDIKKLAEHDGVTIERQPVYCYDRFRRRSATQAQLNASVACIRAINLSILRTRAGLSDDSTVHPDADVIRRRTPT
jgi:hypothetical protein